MHDLDHIHSYLQPTLPPEVGSTKMGNYITAIRFVQNKLHILSAIKSCTSEETTTLLEIAPVDYIKIDNFPTPLKITPGTFIL
jgi:hypothetical protein